MHSLRFRKSEHTLHFLQNQEFKECDRNNSKICQMEELQFAYARRQQRNVARFFLSFP